MSSKRALSLLCLVFAISGCDENPTTAPVTVSQAIVGQVISQEVNVEVSAWQAHLIKATTADSAGYFILDDLPVGLYEVRLVTPSGRHLSIKSVTVQANLTTSLKEIRLSPPSWPLYDVYPGDSTLGVPPLLPSIRITSTMPLDLLSLQSAASFSPAVQGTWQRTSNYIGPTYGPYYYYEFPTTGALEVATKYTIRIGSGLTVAGGQAWGDSLESVFFTDSLRLLGLQTESYFGSNPSQVQPRRDFSLYAQFNAFVNPDSLTKATSFTPSIQGVWVADRYYRGTGILQFFHTGDVGLRAEQTYVMHIDGDVPLVGSSTASGELSAVFQTQPLQVIDSSPRQGEIDFCTGCGVYLLLNSEMDSTSLAAAFSFQTLQGDSVPGVLGWYRQDQVGFDPDSALTPGVVYVARLTTAASSLWGDHLKENYELYFRIH